MGMFGLYASFLDMKLLGVGFCETSCDWLMLQKIARDEM